MAIAPADAPRAPSQAGQVCSSMAFHSAVPVGRERWIVHADRHVADVFEQQGTRTEVLFVPAQRERGSDRADTVSDTNGPSAAREATPRRCRIRTESG